MSGAEIAGFVLGGFPLLISAAEHYRDGFEPLLKWKRFRTEFTGFIDAIDIEKQIYNNMLERFLLSAHVPDEELQFFLKYDGWKREDLVSVLQKRLGSSYGVYMSTVRKMDELTEELKDVLSLKNGKIDWAGEGAGRWEYQMKRIRFSFSNRGPEILAKFEAQNRKFGQLLESKEKLQTIKATRKDTSWGNIFECIRRHANSLHSALQKNWNCDCTTPHKTDLQLQQRSTGGWTSIFNVAFETQLDIITGTDKRREFMIRLKADKGSEEVSKVHTRSFADKPSTETQYLDLGRLRRNFETKSTPQVIVMPCPNPVLSDTPSTLSLSGYIDKIGKPASYEHKPQHVSANETLPERKHRVWPLGHKTKPRKSVRMDIAPSVVLRTKNIPESLSLNPELSNSVGGYDGDIEIKDLCSRLQALDPKSACVGYIVDEDQYYHELVFVQKNIGNPQKNSYISLETVLRDGQVTNFNRQQRHRTACVLASSFLQLQTTPWLPETFGKEDIWFYKHDLTILFDHPFVRHSFKSNRSCHVSAYTGDTSPAKRFVARSSLNNLGIVLLEICYSQAIEDQPIRKQYLGLDGRPHEHTNFMTARDWAESVCEQEPEWEYIIKCCIFCMFEEKADWDNKKFTAAVYESVVESLEKMVMKWSKA